MWRLKKAMRGTSGKRLTYQEIIGNPQEVDKLDLLRRGLRADYLPSFQISNLMFRGIGNRYLEEQGEAKLYKLMFGSV